MEKKSNQSNTNDVVIKTENIHKLFKFEGWRKEILWIIITILILFTGYSYYNEMSTCEDIAKDPCSICFKVMNQSFDNNQKAIEAHDKYDPVMEDNNLIKPPLV